MGLKKLFDVPINIKRYSISIFFCILGLGIGDTFFSIYIKSIVKFALGVSIFGAIYPLTKLLIVPSVGIINDQGKSQDLIYFGKIFWALGAILFFFAGIFNSRIPLLLGCIFSGFAGATIYPSYWTIFKKLGNRKNRGKIFGFHYASINLGYCVGALVCAVVILFLRLPYIFLFMVLFILISLILDNYINNFPSNKLDKEEKNSLVLGRKRTLKNLGKCVLSLSPWKDVISILKTYNSSMYAALSAQALINLMEYVGYLFIPIIAIENNLSLPQIAVITAITWLPNIFTIFAGNLSDHYNKKLLIGILLLIGGFFYILLGTHNSFVSTLVITFGISSVIAFIFPMISSLISDNIKAHEEGAIAGIKEFVATSGEILGSLGFGFFISILGIQSSFIAFGVILSFLAIYIIVKKLVIK